VSYLCVVLSTALASPPSVGQASADEKLVWQEFLQWLTAQAPQSDPRHVSLWAVIELNSFARACRKPMRTDEWPSSGNWSFGSPRA
jgi:hypothetical protein